ncbi:MAG: methyltransferase domain-containing protein [Alphaproteobacteria bacterium]|nr:methyltransferase domain-containing protein [Alphaproteobacteria bacterium]
MRQVGIEPGWRCLDIGAGGGSMTQWLAEQVGPGGHVVAVDYNPRFLNVPPDLSIEVRKIDIESAELERDTFDLAYTRFVLMHFRDPLQVLRKMVDALKPDGLLVVEGMDVSTMTAVDPQHPMASGFMRASQKFQDSAYETSLMHTRLGLDLPAMLGSLGMQDIGNHGRTAVVQGGTLAAHFYRLCFEVFDPGHICRGVVTEAEAEARCRALNDPSFAFVEPTVYTVWGRKPSVSPKRVTRLHS